MDRIEAIVRSMTPHERVAPKIINGSRRARIAKGSGVHVSEVNWLLERFGEAQKMMKKLASGGGHPGHARRAAAAPRRAAKGKEEEAGEVRQPGQGGRSWPQAEANAGQGPAHGRRLRRRAPRTSTRADLNLPKGFEKFLGK